MGGTAKMEKKKDLVKSVIAAAQKENQDGQRRCNSIHSPDLSPLTNLRKLLKKQLYAAGVPKIEIERDLSVARVSAV